MITEKISILDDEMTDKEKAIKYAAIAKGIEFAMNYLCTCRLNRADRAYFKGKIEEYQNKSKQLWTSPEL